MVKFDDVDTSILVALTVSLGSGLQSGWIELPAPNNHSSPKQCSNRRSNPPGSHPTLHDPDAAHDTGTNAL